MLAHLPLILLAQATGTPTPPEPAPAEQAPEQADAGRLGTAQQDGSGSGDIIVTARRRSETVQTVPIAISVLGGQALADVGAYNVNRITQLQPSLQFYSTNPRNSAANIRGLGAPFGLTNDGIEQGVGIYVDQVYYSRIASATFDFTDIPVRIANADGQVYFGYDGSYRSNFSSNPSPSAYTNIDGYALSNFRLGFKAKNDFNVFGWVRNAFDRDYYEVLAIQSGSTGLVVGQPADPRTYGVTVSKSF